MRHGLTRRGEWIALLGLFGYACAGPDRGPDGRPELLVAAASDLAAVMPELAAGFEAGTGVRVTATVGSSGQLAQQILQGAPVDVFLSADRSWVDRLVAENRIVTGTQAVYARGRLVLYASPGATAEIRSLEDLAGPRVRRIAIANPESAPYGRAAKQALQRSGMWDVLIPKIVIAENARQALQFIESGGADVALASRALVSDAIARRAVVPVELYDPLDHALGVIAGRPHEAQARAFAAFVLANAGRAILARHHFELPATEASR
jgi:molybdate transport system substrate-binding protein